MTDSRDKTGKLVKAALILLALLLLGLRLRADHYRQGGWRERRAQPRSVQD